MHRNVYENSPLISVFMPTHNRRGLLERAVSSVLSQTYKKFELLIVDDGSEDGTWKYLKSITDPRVRVFRHENPKGACAARNFAISQALGVFVTGLDDDDYFDQDRLLSLYRGWDKNFSFVFSRPFKLHHFFLAPVFYLSRSVKLSQLLNYNLVGGFCLVEPEKIKAVGGFDVNMPALQDYDLWVRLVEKYGPAKVVFGNTYIVDASHGGERITNSRNRVIAYDLFMKKHIDAMSSSNVNSIILRKSEWSCEPIPLMVFLRSFFDGNFRWALRVVFSSLRLFGRD